jgi:flavin-dependent thymidylate synthase
MKVTLIDYTGKGNLDPSRYAANILVYTRSTRLKMTPGLLEEVAKREDYEILKELKEMANTLPSSWEFIHLTFLIEEVTRAFTHQLVRTRTASYAQQAMRIVKMEDFKYETGPTLTGHYKGMYEDTMKQIAETYEFLADTQGVATEDARGILPTNILTNINMSINMRNWINLIRKRSSARVQDEYHRVIDQMVIEVEKVYPWIYLFVKNDPLKARLDLQNMIYENPKLSGEEKIEMIKKLDIVIQDL